MNKNSIRLIATHTSFFIVGGLLTFFLIPTSDLEFTAATTTHLPPGEGEKMVVEYQKHPIHRFKADDDGSVVNIKSFEFDTALINAIRDPTKHIARLNVYIGRHVNNKRFALIAVGVNSDGKVLRDEAFDWHKPCPSCSQSTTPVTDPDHPINY